MLKFFFFILLLANGALLAYQQGYFETLFPSGREPARVKNQLNADKLKLEKPPAGDAAQTRSEPAAPAAPAAPASTPAAPKPAAAPAAPAAPAPTTPAAPAAPATPAAPPAAEPAPVSAVPASATVQSVSAVSDAGKSVAKPAAKPAVLACADIGNFNAEEAKRFSAQLAPLALGRRVTQRPVQEVASHMVYIPPQADKESAEKKAGELRRLGIDDFFIIQDNSPLRWGISLGVFKMEEAARAHLANLNQKGVRSARIGQRSVSSHLVAFRLRDLDEDSSKAVQKIKAAYARQEMRNCEGA
jgi:hypothetical protein